jgi:hypothetical protein
MNRICLSAAALILAAAPAGAQEVVHLRFGWEPGMAAQVEYEQVRVRQTDGRATDSLRIASTYRMDVSQHPSGLSVVYSGTRWTELPAADPVLGRLYEALTRTSSGGRARTVVSRAGQFLRVEGADSLSREVAAAVQPLLRDVDAPLERAVRGMVSAMASPQALTAAAADEWNVMVWVWADEELEMGDPYELESSFQFPFLPGVRIPLHLELRVLGRIPCTADEREQRCVSLRMSSIPDQEALASAMHQFLDRSGAPAAEVRAAMAQLNMQTSMEVHAEPGTLKPYFMRITRNTVAEGGATRQRETRTFRFRYAP